MEESPLAPTRMDIVSTIVQNGDIVELDQNIGTMVPTVDFVTLVSSFTIIIGLEHINHWCMNVQLFIQSYSLIDTILFSY